MVNWERIDTDAVEEISRVVEVIDLLYSRGPEDLQIEVYEYPSDKFPHGNKYMGVLNYAFWGPKQVSPYRSTHLHDTIERAINDAVNSFKMFDKPDDYPKESTIWVKYTPGDDRYVDGYGELISREEAEKRRAEYEQQSEEE